MQNFWKYIIEKNEDGHSYIEFLKSFFCAILSFNHASKKSMGLLMHKVFLISIETNRNEKIAALLKLL